MNKLKILFVCIENSVRSQMAEAFLNEIAGDIFEASSAGIEPGKLNPLAVAAMANIGIDISKNKTKSILEFFKNGERFDYVISVCDETSGEKCPIFPGAGKRLHWEFTDTSVFKGTYKGRLQKTRQLRDKIENKVKEFVKELTGHGAMAISAPEKRCGNDSGMELAWAKR